MSKSEQYPTTPSVDAISEINFSGNMTPRIWYSCADLKYPSGKTYLTAITLLSDICYWYSRSVDDDARTGQIFGYYRKFHGDKLEKDYESWGAQFGLSARETRDAVTHLEKAGLIIRTVKRPENRIFLEPVAEKILAITFPNGMRVTPKRQSAHVQTEGASRQDATPPTFERERTSTKSTAKISFKQQQQPVIVVDGSKEPDSGFDSGSAAIIADLISAGIAPKSVAARLATANPECAAAWFQYWRVNTKLGAGFLRNAIESGELPPVARNGTASAPSAPKTKPLTPAQVEARERASDAVFATQTPAYQKAIDADELGRVDYIEKFHRDEFVAAMKLAK